MKKEGKEHFFKKWFEKKKNKKNVVGVVAHLVEHPLGVGEARGSKPCNSNFLKFFFLFFTN